MPPDNKKTAAFCDHTAIATRRADNPGITAGGRVSFSNGDSAWQEEFDLVESLASVLEAEGFSVDRRDSFVQMTRFGLSLAPRVVGIELLLSGGVHTVTTLEFLHPEVFPQGLFEFQHASGDDGFEARKQYVLVTTAR